MFKRFGEYILANRRNAALMALLFSVVPLMQWVSTVILGLVTLRKGALDGFLVMLAASLVLFILAFQGHPEFFLFGFIGGNLFVWLVALVLMYTVSWTMVIEATMLLGILAVLFVHWIMPDISQWWMGQFEQILSSTQASLAESSVNDMLQTEQRMALQEMFNDMKSSGALKRMATMMTGSLVATICFVRLIKLSLSRWWQAHLYNPGGLRGELHAIRLGYTAVVVAILSAVLAFMDVQIAWDIVPLIILGFALAGLSVFHCLVYPLKSAQTILTVFYIVLFCVVMALPFMVDIFILLLAVLAIIDSFYNLRTRFSVAKRGE